MCCCQFDMERQTKMNAECGEVCVSITISLSKFSVKALTRQGISFFLFHVKLYLRHFWEHFPPAKTKDWRRRSNGIELWCTENSQIWRKKYNEHQIQEREKKIIIKEVSVLIECFVWILREFVLGRCENEFNGSSTFYWQLKCEDEEIDDFD